MTAPQAAEAVRQDADVNDWVDAQLFIVDADCDDDDDPEAES